MDTRKFLKDLGFDWFDFAGREQSDIEKAARTLLPLLPERIRGVVIQYYGFDGPPVQLKDIAQQQKVSKSVINTLKWDAKIIFTRKENLNKFFAALTPSISPLEKEVAALRTQLGVLETDYGVLKGQVIRLEKIVEQLCEGRTK